MAEIALFGLRAEDRQKEGENKAFSDIIKLGGGAVAARLLAVFLGCKSLDFSGYFPAL